MTTVTGSVKVLDVPDDVCVTTMRDLVMQLSRFLVVEFDEEKITNVVVSSNEPDTTARDVLWFRINSAGEFVGLHVFIQGEWIQVFPAPNEVTRVYGRSDTLPPGYALLDESRPGIPAGSGGDIKSHWVLHPDQDANAGVYIVFEVVWVGL